MYFVVKTSLDLSVVAPALRGAVWSVDRHLPVERIRRMDDVLDRATGQHRFRTTLILIFGIAALALSVIGIYGVVSNTVAQGVKEIAVRIALGAEPKHIFRLVLGRGLKLTVAGAAIGVAGALLLTSTFSSLLFGVASTDPLTFGAVVILCGSSSLLACYLPARRATQVDSIVSLR
jgi:putative ABC transport system permease protein